MNTHTHMKRFGLLVAVVGALSLVPSAVSQTGLQYPDGTGAAARPVTSAA
jgi:hypothetical protein